jgi:hypothetical protein
VFASGIGMKTLSNQASGYLPERPHGPSPPSPPCSEVGVTLERAEGGTFDVRYSVVSKHYASAGEILAWVAAAHG